TLIGVGARKSTNRHWAKSCHEFRYYENLVESPVESTPRPTDAAQQLQADPAAEIFKRAVRLLAETHGDAWVNQASIWHMIKRLDSTFDPKEHGHANFLAMVKAFDSMVEVKEGESDQVVRLR
ncbi:MAG TPA: hypothetical protein DCP03_06380, partial [Polaromonas sp.]|nr:hypothetical protein [Polaromonas sp.]